MKRVSLGQLSAAIRATGNAVPASLERAMREGALVLIGEIQAVIAETDPQPVDQGQFKASWGEPIDVPGGAIVGSSAKQALWIERGRLPGPVPFEPIREWVRRHKDMWADLAAELGDDDAAIDQIATAVQRKVAERGYAPRWVLRRAIERLDRKMPAIIRRNAQEASP